MQFNILLVIILDIAFLVKISSSYEDYYMLRLWPHEGTGWNYPLCQGAIFNPGFDISYIHILHPYNSQYTDCAPCNCYLLPTGTTNIESVTIHFSNNFYAPNRHSYTYRDWNRAGNPTGMFSFSIQAHTTYTIFTVNLNDDYVQQFSLYQDRNIDISIAGGTLGLRCSNNNFTTTTQQAQQTTTTVKTTTKLKPSRMPSKFPEKLTTSQVMFSSMQNMVTVMDAEQTTNISGLGIGPVSPASNNKAGELPIIMGSVMLILLLFFILLAILLLCITKKRILAYCIEREKKEEMKKERYTTDPLFMSGVVSFVKDDEQILEDRCIYADGEKLFCISQASKGNTLISPLKINEEGEERLSSSTISNKTSTTNNGDSDYGSYVASENVNQLESRRYSNIDEFENDIDNNKDEIDNNSDESTSYVPKFNFGSEYLPNSQCWTDEDLERNDTEFNQSNNTEYDEQNNWLKPTIVDPKQVLTISNDNLAARLQQHNIHNTGSTAKQSKAEFTSPHDVFYSPPEPEFNMSSNNQKNQNWETDERIETPVFKQQNKTLNINSSPEPLSTHLKIDNTAKFACKNNENRLSSPLQNHPNYDRRGNTNDEYNLVEQFLSEFNKKAPIVQTFSDINHDTSTSNNIFELDTDDQKYYCAKKPPISPLSNRANSQLRQSPFQGKKKYKQKPIVPRKPQFHLGAEPHSKTLPQNVRSLGLSFQAETDEYQPTQASSDIIPNRRQTLPVDGNTQGMYMKPHNNIANNENSKPKFAQIGSNHERTNLSPEYSNVVNNNLITSANMLPNSQKQSSFVNLNPNIVNSFPDSGQNILHYEINPTVNTTNSHIPTDDPGCHYAQIDPKSLAKRQKPPTPVQAEHSIIYAELDLKKPKN